MAQRKSRRYRKSSHSSHHLKDAEESGRQPFEEKAALPAAAPQPEARHEQEQAQERKSSSPLGFLSSLFGNSDRGGKSGSPLLKVLNHDIYLDDLLLVGLLFLMLTEQDKDEILLLILLYLLLDIF